MKALLVLRHAKAELDAPSGSDFDRRLTDAGRRASAAVGDDLRASAHRVNAIIASPAARVAETVAGVVLAAGNVIVFNVGDSRVYGLSERGLARISVDDSPPLAPGQTTTSIVTQTMGGNAHHTSIDPHVTTLPLEPGGRFLVCTDGLTDVIAEADIGAILGRHAGLEASVELWRAAMEAGGPDNITLAVVEVTDDGSDD